MMHSKNRLLLTAFMLVAIVFFSACKEDDPIDPTPSPTTGEVKIEFNYVFGSEGVPWDINTTLRHPKTGDTFNVLGVFILCIQCSVEK